MLGGGEGLGSPCGRCWEGLVGKETCRACIRICDDVSMLAIGSSIAPVSWQSLCMIGSGEIEAKAARDMFWRNGGRLSGASVSRGESPNKIVERKIKSGNTCNSS